MEERPKAYSYLRMSTDVQLKGDSRRRQMELSQAYAAAHGLDLVPATQLEDIGISAFKGANIRDGALGVFLTAVRNKKIEAGSYLLIESLDRLSRQEVMKSLSIFIDLVNSGIVLVTLADDHVYSGKIDLADLIYSIVIMSRAHEESLTKSKRLSAVWANKRKNLVAQKLTKLCPAWLRLSKDRSVFEVDRQRAAIVRSIFQDSAAGLGNFSITRKLNRKKVRPFGRSKGWQTSYVAKILSNRAVLGEFQAHKLKGTKRILDGDPIEGYFPKVIDDRLFYRAQNARLQRKTHGGGRKGEFRSNLFSGLCICWNCQSPMRYENKGAGPKGGRLLVCDGARRGLPCVSKTWKYEDFEASFLAFVQELDINSVIGADAAALERKNLAEEISHLEGRLSSLLADRERTYQLFLNAGEAADFVSQKLQSLQVKILECEAPLKLRRDELAVLDAQAMQRTDGATDLHELIEKVRTRSDGVAEIRAKVAMRLQSVVKKIRIAVTGFELSWKQDAARYSDKPEQRADALEKANDPRQQRRFFSVQFHDNSFRIVTPDPNDPLKFLEQEIETEDEIIEIKGDGSIQRFQHFRSEKVKKNLQK